MVEPEGEDNYLGELGLARCWRRWQRSRRGVRSSSSWTPLSPIRAWLKFRRKHHRTQMGYYGLQPRAGPASFLKK
eukprot:2717076-Prymnesium_polylepis.1